jgi:hypothetical protein
MPPVETALRPATNAVRRRESDAGSGSWTPPLVAFLATRALLVAACYGGLTASPVHPLLPWQGQAFPGNNWLDGWVRWDAMWYESIVDSHPRFLPPNMSNANFFPGYAVAAWLAGVPFQWFLSYERAFYAGGLVVSYAAFALGLRAVHRIATSVAGAAAARRTVWLMALFPFSFFFSAVYAESLYFCLAVYALRCALGGRWRTACAFAALASVTRIQGFALFPALAIAYLERHDFNWRSLRDEAASAAMLAVAPVVLVIYFAVRYGDVLAFLHARQAGWERAAGLGTLAGDFAFFTAGPHAGSLWDVTRTLLGWWYLALVPASAILAALARRTLGMGPTLWVWLSIVMALANGLDGMGRFTAVLFPVFLAAAMLLTRQAAFLATCACFVPFLVLFLLEFARWRPVL